GVDAAATAVSASRSSASTSTAATVTDRFSTHFLLSGSRVRPAETAPARGGAVAARASAPLPGGEPGRGKEESRKRHGHDRTIACRRDRPTSASSRKRVRRRTPLPIGLESGLLDPPMSSSPYDTIAELYDPWSASVVEDVAFYLEEARRSGGPVVELGVGTGRIAVPIAADGIRVIGVDSSRGMLDVCARRAALAGVELDLRVGDLRQPPIAECVPLVICPFRSLLHMHTGEDRRLALAA